MNMITRAIRVVRRPLAAAAMVALGTTSLVVAQPAAAAETYNIEVEFQNVTFAKIDDGCYGWLCMYTDTTMEIFGSVTARTSATGGGWSSNGYRNFGTWGSDPWACPAQPVSWDSTTSGPCLKEITDDSSWLSGAASHAFNDVLLCGGTAKDKCSTGYSKNNNRIALVVHPGDSIIVNVGMLDYDKFSPNDTVCVGGAGFGPFDSYQLASLSVPGSIHMADNGEAECQVKFNIHRV